MGEALTGLRLVMQPLPNQAGAQAGTCPHGQQQVRACRQGGAAQAWQHRPHLSQSCFPAPPAHPAHPAPALPELHIRFMSVFTYMKLCKLEAWAAPSWGSEHIQVQLLQAGD